MSKTGFSDVLLLARAYLANPSAHNERTLYYFIKLYFYEAESANSIASHKLLFRLRYFLFQCDNNRQAKTKFHAFAAREYLIRFTRPSPPLLSGLTPAGDASGFFNRADTSTAPLSLAGSH